MTTRITQPLLGAAFVCNIACGEPKPPALRDGTTGAPAECTKIQCLDGVHVSVVSAAATFTAGGYAVTFTQGDVVETCSFELLGGFDVCGLEGTCLGPTDCDASFGFGGPNHSIAFFVESVGGGEGSETDAPETDTAFEAGSAVPDPPLLEIVVQRGRAVVFSDVLAPVFQPFAPNGEGCEPVCRVGQVSVVVPPD